MDKIERDELIELYGRGFDLLKAALAEVPQEALKFKPEPKEWSVHEIIIHLADSESISAFRVRKLIVEPGGFLMPYDQDKWAIGLNYHEQNTEDALEVLRLARKTTYELLKRQPDEVFTHALINPETKNEFTFERWLNIYPNHIPAHIEQIKNNIKIWREKK
jgi:hypothetical protein